MLKKVEEYVEKWHMLKKEDRIIVGVSGGADSVCLLFILLELQKKIPFEIIVVHVNHELRGIDADEDEAYVKKICEEHQILCVTYSENVELIAKKRKQSTEEAGRDVRREAFRHTMEMYGGTKIALAHHKNDNVETFVMNLVRGTGLKGLCGIRPVAGNIVRPLLCLERQEIEEFLEENHISYRTDKTNKSDDYTRNRIRNHLIPYMEEQINPCVVTHMNDTMEKLLEIQGYMEEEQQVYYQKCVKEEKQCCIISEAFFTEIPKVFQPVVLKEALVKITGKEKDIESIHLKGLQELFQKQVGKKLDLPYETEAWRTYEGIRIQRRGYNSVTEQIECEISFINGEKQEITLKDTTITFQLLDKFPINCEYEQKNNTKWFDYDIIKCKLCVRTRRPGDYITIHPDGRTQKLKSYFINEKIPKEQREKILLVADGSHILWIVGYRTNCMYHVNRNTKRILEIQMNEGDSHGRDS